MRTDAAPEAGRTRTRLRVLVCIAAVTTLALPPWGHGATAARPAERARHQPVRLCEKVSCNREVVIVTANIHQESADGAPRCTSQESPSGCNQRRRETAFVKRIIRLAQRERGVGHKDGMGVIPDLILLQEARRKDARHIISEFESRTGYTFKIAMGLRTTEIPDREARVGKYCEQHTDTDSEKERCKDQIRVLSGSMILFNKDTMTMIRDGGSYVDSRFDPETEAARCENDSENCVTWKRHFMAEFAEKRLNQAGVPTGSRTGYRVAATSVHYSYVLHVIKRDLRDEKIKDWSVQIARKMIRRYGSADALVIAGDFNYERCLNKTWKYPGDYESEPPEAGENGCVYSEWWKALTRTRQQGYTDVTHELYKKVDPVTRDIDGRLIQQMRDGCDQKAGDGSCNDRHTNNRRIDLDFVDRTRVVAASRDLSCGESHPRNGVAHCDDKLNPERYSDHRLHWVAISSR